MLELWRGLCPVWLSWGKRMTPRERNIAQIDRIAFWHGLDHRDILLRWAHRGRGAVMIDAKRDCAQYFMRKGKSLAETARIMDRDHTTVSYYLNGKKSRKQRMTEQ